MSIYNFKARISSELYYSHDSFWGVYSFTTEDDIPHIKKVKTSITNTFGLTPTEEGIIAGKVQQLDPGQTYSVRAEITHNKKYGYQYVPLQVNIEKPTTEEDAIQFLKAFCTPRQAQELIHNHPNFIEEVLEGEKNFSCSMTTKKLNQVIEGVEENYAAADIMVMLTPLGVTFATIKKILNDVKNTTLIKEMLMENPYVLTKVHGLGFKKIDDVALKVTPELKHSKHRMKSYMEYHLREVANGDGHTLVPLSQLRIEANSNAPEAIGHFDQLLNDPDFITKSGSMVGLKFYYENESFIYDIVRELSSHCNVSVEDDFKYEETEEKLGIKFTDIQKKAIESTNTSDFAIISGSAGTGKTTVIQGVLDMFKGIYSIGMCALAAKASQRMTEVTGHPASTIHRLLGWKGDKWKYNERNKLPYDIIIMDEASMVNSYLFRKLLGAINTMKTKLILVFDHAQLPPIGAGNIAADLLRDEKLVVNKFTEIHRQAARSGILLDANTIRSGRNPLVSEQNCSTGELQDMHYSFIRGETKDLQKKYIQNQIILSFHKAAKRYGIENVVIIVPRKKHAVNSTTEINKIIHEQLFDQDVPRIKSGQREFAQGARVIQRANNYEKDIVNGEVGNVIEVDNISDVCVVEFANQKEIEYDRKMLKDLDLAYALTVHSYQGSQSDIVIIGIDYSHYILLDNCLLYTAVTRAAKQCKVVADYSAFKFAIGKNKNTSRRTFLGRIINEELPIYTKEEVYEKKNQEESSSGEEVPF